MDKTLVRIQKRNTAHVKSFCNAPLKTGNRCKKPAGSETPHLGFGKCARHGGNTQEGMRLAAIAEAHYLGMTYTTPIPTDPSMALVEEMARTHGAIVWLDLRMEAELLREEKNGKDPLTHLIEPRMALLRKLRDSERDRLVRISTVCINLGLKARELRLAEQMGSLIQSVLEATLNDLNLTPEQRDQAKQILAAHLQHAARTVVEAELVS